MTTFLDLHMPGTPLLIPNPWDAGSAKLLASLGFEALATTSSGFAATLGRLDGAVTRDEGPPRPPACAPRPRPPRRAPPPPRRHRGGHPRRSRVGRSRERLRRRPCRRSRD